ncbi:craniofacial development protein 2-like [Elysia marginata]|uniref:Craniofacial development protein 2-like n=1 Tax=Elysia marginata TaxID=1093978 RepID=A0AAV4I681_9GAST|nr:craniofacial development protein 2-like [Elysia marginata]
MHSGGERNERGVAIILDPETKKAVKGVWKYSDRILLVTLSAKPFDIALIQLYAPTSEYSEEEIEVFYEQVNDVVKQVRSQDILIVMGDFNAKVGEGRIGNIVGPYGLGDSNKQGERLVD